MSNKIKWSLQDGIHSAEVGLYQMKCSPITAGVAKERGCSWKAELYREGTLIAGTYSEGEKESMKDAVKLLRMHV